MNRRERRRGQREGWVCIHGYVKKTDERGNPWCPYGCGFEKKVRGMVSYEELREYDRGFRTF